MKKVLLINGPNLNLLGTREPEIYGTDTVKDVERAVATRLSQEGVDVLALHSNHEGEILDFIHLHRDAAFAIVNAGALTHTSIALRDALKGVDLRFVEVHISNVHAREEFRHHSYLSDIASGIVIGCGVYGYQMAASFVAERLK